MWDICQYIWDKNLEIFPGVPFMASLGACRFENKIREKFVKVGFRGKNKVAKRVRLLSRILVK